MERYTVASSLPITNNDIYVCGTYNFPITVTQYGGLLVSEGVIDSNSALLL